ncbi:hypothetical protein RZS08_50730, partial [Arthrospira platensis SPKY1]|nr:hypothetical protein [Arthrospira platensis SPKY1]
MFVFKHRHFLKGLKGLGLPLVGIVYGTSVVFAYVFYRIDVSVELFTKSIAEREILNIVKLGFSLCIGSVFSHIGKVDAPP